MADPLLPATPATVTLAIGQANDLAYGFAKHTDDGYWNDLYKNDPDYAWKRMLGWLAGGGDVARFGLYAIPPSPWHSDPPVVVPPVLVPTGPGPTASDVILAAFQVLEAKIDAVTAAVTAPIKAPVYEGTVQIPFFGSAKVTLTPKA